jgi:diacylglycerol kinase family enzyme
MSRRVLLIGNPVAGGGALSKIREAAALIREHGYATELQFTSRRGDAEAFAREVRGREDLLVIAAGGDGTYNEVANGLVHSAVPMAILPLGTTSVLAEELEIPHTLKGAVSVALRGEAQMIHLGKITCNPPAPRDDARHSARPTPLTRHFLLMAGIGYDGETVSRVNGEMKRYAGKSAYVLSGIRTLLCHRPLPLSFSISAPFTIVKQPRVAATAREDTASDLKLSGYSAIIAKASCYGGKFRVAPDARLTDPFLYLFVTHGRRKVDLLRYVVGILLRRHLSLGDISYVKSGKVSVEGTAHVQIDGDYAGTTPARIEVVPDALRLVMKAPLRG